MNKGALLAKVSSEYLRTDLPEFKSGDTVKIYQIIKEGDKQRIQIFEGLVISKKGSKTTDASFIVRKTYNGGIAVEKVYPLHSPLVEKIEVLKRGRVRRAKLYYMRDRFCKKARIQEMKDFKK